MNVKKYMTFSNKGYENLAMYRKINNHIFLDHKNTENFKITKKQYTYTLKILRIL
jgi:hypothetical protein